MSFHVVLGLAAMPVLSAAEPYSARVGVSDSMLARSALAALDRDPMLQDLIIVVSVVDRQAVIGGAVPTPEMAMRAEAIVRQATGVDVKNRCMVQSRPDPLIRAVADRLSPTARRPELPGIVRPPRVSTFQEPVYTPSTAIAAAPVPTPPKEVVTLKIPSSTGTRPSLLLDPTAAPTGPRYAAQPPVPTLSPVPVRLTTTPASANFPVAVPQRPMDLMGTLLDLRRSEARFAGLTVEMREGTVFLAGNTSRDADAWDFADRVRRVPGVRQVVMGTINRK